MSRRTQRLRPLAAVLVTVPWLCIGCGKSGASPPLVEWKDAAGATWQAPLRTPAPEDPIWAEHPGAGVVLKCAKTGDEVLVPDPDAWLAHRGRPDSPFRSPTGAPLVLPK